MFAFFFYKRKLSFSTELNIYNILDKVLNSLIVNKSIIRLYISSFILKINCTFAGTFRNGI